MEKIEAKSILSPYFEGGWYDSNYNMNLYKGCCHGCIYCDSRSECYQIKEFDRVRTKANVLEILEKELYTKKKKGVILTGSMSDTYNPFEKEEKIMRGALELIDRYGYGVAVDTKSDLVVRDLDLLERISRHSPVHINFTVTTADDEMCKKVERSVCPSSARLKALHSLRESGISGGILLMPILPFINDTEENISAIMEKASAANARWVFAFKQFGMTLRGNQREHYYKWLDKLFPGLKELYIRTYRNEYSCTSPRSKDLRKLFLSLCSRYDLLHDMRDINHMLKNERNREEYTQLTIFD